MARIVERYAQELCKMKDHIKAYNVYRSLLDQRIYRQSTSIYSESIANRGYWYEELAKITERYIKTKSVIDICLTGLSDGRITSCTRTLYSPNSMQA